MKNKVLKRLFVMLLCVCIILEINAFAITVNAAIPVQSVTISQRTLTLYVDETASLSATVNPYNATDKTIRWGTSNRQVATVSANGVVTAKSVGTTVISALSTNVKRDTCTVIVKERPVIEVSSINISKTTASVNVGGYIYLSATAYPVTAINRSITWSSSDSSVATVDMNGTVKTLKMGTATITARASNGVSARCSVTVTGIPVTQVSVDIGTFYVKGQTATIKTTVYPDNATDKSVKWSSSDSSVVYVDSNSVLHACGYGTATITADFDGGKVHYNATVKVGAYTPIDYVFLSTYNKSLQVGDTWTLGGYVSPSYANNQKLTWTTDASWIATVYNGKITAMGEGTAHITATSHDGKTATCTVTVKGVPVKDVVISKKSLSLTVKSGLTHRWQLSATVSPSNASNKNVTWSSSNSKVATVTSGGYVTAVSPGTTVITVKSSNGQADYCTVTVKQ